MSGLDFPFQVISLIWYTLQPPTSELMSFIYTYVGSGYLIVFVSVIRRVRCQVVMGVDLGLRVFMNIAIARKCRCFEHI